MDDFRWQCSQLDFEVTRAGWWFMAWCEWVLSEGGSRSRETAAVGHAGLPIALLVVQSFDILDRSKIKWREGGKEKGRSIF